MSSITQVYGASTLTDGLVGYWNMDSADINWSANTIIDRSGHGNTGSLISMTDGANTVTGKIGQALRFSTAPGSYVDIAGSQSLNVSIGNAYSYAAWINLSSAPSNSPVFYKDDSDQFFIGDGYVSLRPGGTVSYTNFYVTQFVQNQWYHIVATYDGTTQIIYIDGVIQCSVYGPCPIQTGTVGSGTHLKIGGGTGFSGLIDEVRVYDRALSAQEVTELYQTTSFDTDPLLAPTVPQDFVSSSHTADTVSLSWTANSEPNLAHYNLYQGGVLIAVLDAATVSYQVKNLLPGTAYLYQLSAVNSTNVASSLTSAVSVTTDAVSHSTKTPDQYLAALDHPVYKAGYTLPPLGKWSWPYDYNLKVEMAHWGYALDFGDIDDFSVGQLLDPNSDQSKLVALAHNNPTLYKIQVALPRVDVSLIPEDVYVHNSAGALVNPPIWSPEAPDSSILGMATLLKTNLQKVADKTTISLVLNGGERYMGVSGQDASVWFQDPRVVAAYAQIGSLTLSDYQSIRKAHQEMFFADAVHSVTNAPYILYSSGGNPLRAQSCSQWFQYDFDQKYMYTISNFPNTGIYWNEFNNGWTGHLVSDQCLGSSNNDMLSQALNGFGYAVTFGQPLSYNWVNAGYAAHGWGEIERYYGYLKSYYVAGMIGGIAGYFDYPSGGFGVSFDSNSPPHWIQQIEALGQVHAEFSYLEDMLRSGDLLSGPDMNPKNTDQPAYEFRTGYADTRVLARKMQNTKRWLISAWAADGVARTVSVDIPVVGTASVHATPAGSLYDARIVGGVLSVVEIDDGSTHPSPMSLPSSTPDPDNVSYTPDIVAPSTPGNFSATAVSTTRIDLSWTAATDIGGVTGYRVYRNSVPIATVTGTSYSDTGLTASTLYSYMVRATDAAGNLSVAGTAFAVTSAASVNAPSGSGGSTGGGSGGGGSYVVPKTTLPATTIPASTPRVILVPINILMYPGITGVNVTNLQKYLVADGYMLASGVTGRYDTGTTVAIIGAQKKLGIVTGGTAATTGLGLVGSRTKVAINARIAALNAGVAKMATTTEVSSPKSAQGVFTRQLTVGSVGPDVKALQVFLNTHLFTIATKGSGSPGYESTYFGPATRAALIKFQVANKISPATGFFGPMTMGKINSLK